MSEKDQRSHRGRACLAVVAGTGLLLTSLPAIAHAETVVESNTSVPDDVPNLPSAASLVTETTIEAETLTGSVKDSTAKVSTAGQLGNIGFSGDERFVIGTEKEPAKVGQSVTASFDVAAAGTYALAIDSLTSPEMGAYDVAINGQRIGSFDGYGATTKATAQLSLGSAELTAGANTVTFTVTGQHADASAAKASIDVMHLSPQVTKAVIFPGEEAVVKGTQKISAAGPATGAVSVDGGPATEVPRNLGTGSVGLVFDSSDFQGKTFPNYVEVGGEQIIVNNTARTVGGQYTRTSATIPAALLTPGENTIRIAAGGSPANCGINFDDFGLKNVALQLGSGKVLDDNAQTGMVAIGDGSCGSNTSIPKHHDYTFTLPGEGTGINWDLDTTKLTDGQHTLSVKTDGGGAVSSRITVDNTAPVIDSVSFSEGELLKGAKRLDVKVTDAVTKVDITAELDGESVEPGSVLDSDALYLGSHELVVTATDAANNTTSHTITFNSVPERPVIDGEGFPLDGATGISTRPTLRSTWMDPTREDITVDFHEARLSAPSSVINGEAEDPESVNPGTETTKAGAAKTVDGKFVDSVSSSKVPYQQFDLPVAGKSGEYLEARWDGVIDPERDAVLLAWNMADKAWEEIGREQGQPEGNTTVRGTVSRDFVDTGSNSVHLMVKGADPFRMVASDQPDKAFKDPSNYAFAMSWMTDTQYLSEGATDPGEDNQVPYQNAFAGMTSWIVDNAEKRKIAYSAHTGDIAENWNNGDGTNEEQQAQATREFEFASTQMKKLDDAGIPNGVLPGNHDNLRGANADLYNTYFGASRYEALSRTTDAPFYGDNQGAGDDNTNHYDLFTEGGQDFIALYLGYNVNQTEMDWANRILKANKGRNAILLTHDYLKPSQKPDGSDAPHTDEGERLFKNVVAPNENVFLVLAGHTHGNGLNIKKDVGVKNRNVVEMLADRQFFQIDGERRAGFLRLLQFDTDRAELSVNTYSPYLDNHNAIEFDTQAGRDYTESVDEFTVPIDLNSRTTAFRTDALQLATEVPRAIGSDAVQTGEEATTQWKGLSPNTRYGWFTRASDQDTGTQVSPVFTFTTGERGNGGKDGGKDQSRPGMDDPRYKNTKERFRVASQDG